MQSGVMRIELRDHVLLHDAEGARIARWFGETELGPVFYADSGEALPLDGDRRAIYRRQAERLLERYVAGYRRSGFEAVALAVVLVVLFQGVQAWLGALAPSLRVVPAFAAGVPALAWPLVRELRYRRGLKALRRELSERLALREGVPAQIAQPHRRHNVFLVAQGLVVVFMLASAGAALLRGDQNFGLPWILVPIPLAWALHWASRRVDRVHRRVPESDLFSR